jgi:putative DNA primase/helicase
MMLNALQRIMGKDYAATTEPALIVQKHPDNFTLGLLANLDGIRFVSINETSREQKLNESLIKQLCGGGDAVNAKKLYFPPYEYIPQMKLWVRANFLPRVAAEDAALWERIVTIRFTREIPPELCLSKEEVDQHFNEETEGILAWLVRGYKLWEKHPLSENPPENILVSIKVYHEENDLILEFMNACMKEVAGAKLYTADTYAGFKNYCEQAGYEEARFITAKELTVRLVQLTSTELRTGNGNAKYFHGWELIQDQLPMGGMAR